MDGVSCVWRQTCPETTISSTHTNIAGKAYDVDGMSGLVSAMHSRMVPSLKTCTAAFEHDRRTELLSLCIIGGLIASYLPQHYRIIANRSGEGFSSLFLLLGATSSATSLLNIISLQWGQIGCCKYLSKGQCFESVLGIGQVFFQWFCFNLIFVLFLVYFPLSARYVRTVPLDPPTLRAKVKAKLHRWSFWEWLRGHRHRHHARRDSETTRTPGSSRSSSVSSSDREGGSSSSDGEGGFNPHAHILPSVLSKQSSVALAPPYARALTAFSAVVAITLISTLVTFILLYSLPRSAPEEGSPPAFPGHGGTEHASERAVRIWATTLGLASVLLGCAQYLPQVWLTYQTRLVGSLSIPMMCLQTPGSFVFVYTLAVRPGVNWTSWSTYLVTGVLQGILLSLCIAWKVKQKRLGIDDWGNKLEGAGSGAGERERLLSPTAVRRRAAAAAAAESSVRS